MNSTGLFPLIKLTWIAGDMLLYVLSLLDEFYLNKHQFYRIHMVGGFTTIYAIGAYHHWYCEFESWSGWGVQHYVINFVSGRWLSAGPLVSSNNKTDRHDIMWNIVESGVKHHQINIHKISQDFIDSTQTHKCVTWGHNIYTVLHGEMIIYYQKH
jgi:hypothetical protein